MPTSLMHGCMEQVVQHGMPCPRLLGLSIVYLAQIGVLLVTIGAKFHGAMLAAPVLLVFWMPLSGLPMRSFTAMIPAYLHQTVGMLHTIQGVLLTQWTVVGRQPKIAQTAGLTFANASMKVQHCQKIYTIISRLWSLVGIRPFVTLLFMALLVLLGILCQRRLSHLFAHQGWIGPPRTSIGVSCHGAMLIPAV